jgi:hypothetical protein
MKVADASAINALDDSNILQTNGFSPHLPF